MNVSGLYNLFISQKTAPNNASFVKSKAMASGYHLSKLLLYNNIIFLG